MLHYLVHCNIIEEVRLVVLSVESADVQIKSVYSGNRSGIFVSFYSIRSASTIRMIGERFTESASDIENPNVSGHYGVCTVVSFEPRAKALCLLQWPEVRQ
jgi:hypothetical protein